MNNLINRRDFIVKATLGGFAFVQLINKKYIPHSDTDLILYNANVITLDDQMPNAQAIAISGNLISAVGTNTEVLAMQSAGTQIIDLNSRTVLPGLIEGHDHLLARGYRETGSVGLVRATQRMAANGYTTVHQLGGSPDFIGTAQDLAQKGDLAVRINFYQNYNNSCGDFVNTWNTYPYTEKKDTTVRIVGVKIFSDGGTCGKAPALTTPYQSGSSAGSYGDLFRTQDEMNAIVDTVLKAGYPIAMHAIGDAGIGVGLKAFENSFTGQGNALRCRMEHLRVMREDLADQMAAIGIAASIQYTWAHARNAPNLESKYQPQVWDWLYPWRRLVDRGIPIVGGNDFPFTARIQSMQTISFLATRKVERNDTIAAWMDGDQLTIEEGIQAMTKRNAWIVFEEDVKGTIVPGKLADLTIVSENPMSIAPFDVRYIDIEMTIMDGIIRHNQIGKIRNVVHDAGTFNIGIDDRGLWGNVRSRIGLQYNSIEQMYQGSVLVSYDTTTLATGTFQTQDFATTPSGWAKMSEPGSVADEEVIVEYEDVMTNHPNSVIVKQESFMWKGDPFLLVKYSFENKHSHDIVDLYLGMFMGFNITGANNSWTSYEDDLAGWEENNGLGFAFMHDNNNSSPYIGLAMFDDSGQNVNNTVTYSAGHKINPGGDKERWSQLMRNSTFEQPPQNPSSNTILLAKGPYTINNEQTISPFYIAMVMGASLEDLKNAVNLAYHRSKLVLSNEVNKEKVIDDFYLYQNYPNPFNPSTTIKYSLPQTEDVKIEVFNALGQLVDTILDEKKITGIHYIKYEPQHIESGVYLLRMVAGNYQKTNKMIFLK
jgi:predicted amidohydrolase YtcJ